MNPAERAAVTELSDRDMLKIERRANKATAGPWKCGGPIMRKSLLKVLTGSEHPNGITAHVYEVGHVDAKWPPAVCVVNIPDGGSKADMKANAEFIAAAREDVTALIAEVRRLRALVGQ